MTYNQLINKYLLDFLTATKNSFINTVYTKDCSWQGYFMWACDEIMSVINVPKKEIPIKTGLYIYDYKPTIYIIEYEDSFVTRENDSYCLCITFDGNKFRLFTQDKVLKNGKPAIYFTEKFIDDTSKTISEVSYTDYNKLSVDVMDLIDNE